MLLCCCFFQFFWDGKQYEESCNLNPSHVVFAQGASICFSSFTTQSVFIAICYTFTIFNFPETARKTVKLPDHHRSKVILILSSNTIPKIPLLFLKIWS